MLGNEVPFHFMFHIRSEIELKSNLPEFKKMTNLFFSTENQHPSQVIMRRVLPEVKNFYDF